MENSKPILDQGCSNSQEVESFSIQNHGQSQIIYQENITPLITQLRNQPYQQQFGIKELKFKNSNVMNIPSITQGYDDFTSGDINFPFFFSDNPLQDLENLNTL